MYKNSKEFKIRDSTNMVLTIIHFILLRILSYLEIEVKSNNFVREVIIISILNIYIC